MGVTVGEVMVAVEEVTVAVAVGEVMAVVAVAAAEGYKGICQEGFNGLQCYILGIGRVPWFYLTMPGKLQTSLLCRPARRHRKH